MCSGANGQRDLVSSGSGSALDAVQQELSDLGIFFDDKSQEEVPGRETFVGDGLWWDAITFTEQLYSSWSDMDTLA
jgi:hypothetical protein